MPSPLADNITAAIKRSVSIVDLVGEQRTLTRRGRTFKGLCPFHEDHNPSMDVDPERQRYKCWSCGAGGDIFDFVMGIERVDFREALEILARRARITLPKDRGRPSDNGKQGLHDILQWAQEEFHRCLLQSEVAAPARVYASNRGLTSESIEAFQLGFAPNEWDWLLQRARAKRVTPELLEKSGLARSREKGSGHYDYFRGRLMFPIRDARGRTIAFGGRLLPQYETEDSSKYTNSPYSPIFIKGEHLYGLDRARDGIAKSKTAVVVEGYTDCIMSHQHGLTHVVGTLGTALGSSQVAVLKRYADRVVLVYDGDDAGQKAADRALGLILSQEVELRILSLPDDLDPCDFLLKRGADEFRRGLDSAMDALDFKLQRAGQVFDLGSISGRRQALDFVLSAVAALPLVSTGTAPVTREIVLDSLGKRLGVSSEVVRKRLRELRERSNRASANPTNPIAHESKSTDSPWANESPAERELLEILLSDPSFIGRIAEQVKVEEVTTPGYRRMLEVSIEIFRDGQVFDLDSLRLRLEDREIACRASILAETGQQKGNQESRLLDVLAWFRSQKSEAEEQSQAPRSEAQDGKEAKIRYLSMKTRKYQSRQRKSTATRTV